MNNETAYRGPEVEEASEGSVILGIVGAFLGAVVGAVPWFLASTFTSFFIGYLGFLIGWAAAFGYGKFHGRRSYPLAMVTVVVCSIAALVLTDFASNMFVLCTDKEWQLAASYYGVSVAELAFVLITDPENLHVFLPNLIMGLLIGLLGVASCRQYVRQYTQSGQVASRPNSPVNPAVVGAVNGWAQPASTGLVLPRQFSVRAPKASMVVGIIALVFAVLLLFFALLMAASGVEAVPILLVLSLVLLVEAVFLILQGKNRRLEVDGDQLCAYTTFGKATPFHVSDIGSVSMPSIMTGTSKLCGKNGEVLFKYNNKARNLPLLMQYLAEHNISLRAD